MTRPAAGEWTVLDLESDPVPGDPDSINEIISAYQQLASTTQQAHDLLASGSQIEGGQGKAMDAFRDLIGKLPGRLDTMAQSYSQAIDNYRRYLPSLQEAQSMSLQALDQARQAAAAQSSANAAATAAAAQVAAAQKPAADPTAQSTAQSTAQQAATTARGQQDDAQQALDQAKSLLGQATALRDDAAHACAQALDKLAHDAPQRSLWEKIADAFKAFIKFLESTVIQWITTVLDVLATIASFIFPPLGEAISLLSSGIDVLAALATGDGGKIALALGGVALGLIPGGRLVKDIAKFAGKGVKGLTGSVSRGIGAATESIGKDGKTIGGALPGKGGGASTVGKNRPGDPADTATPIPGRKCENDPVDIATGEVVMTQTDLRLAGVLPLLLQRTHVSSYRAGGWFGPSWASTVDQRLEFDAEGVCFIAADGMILVYPQAVPGTPVLPVTGPQWPLLLDEGGRATVTLEDGRLLEFAAVAGGSPSVLRLGAIRGRDGHHVELVYADGVLAELQHSGGYQVGVTVEQGRIIQIRLLGDEDVVIKQYRYDGRGFLIDVVGSAGSPLRFEYDEDGRMTGWRDSNDMWFRYSYDAAGRCVRTEGADGFLNSRFAYEPRVTRYINSLGHVTTYHLDDAHRTVRQIDPLGHETRYEWDRHGRLLATTDPLGRTERIAYDEGGRVASVGHSDGTRTLIEHPAAEDGIDPFGFADPAGLAVVVGDALGTTTRYGYDAFGRVVEAVDAYGESTTFGWTLEGRLAWRVGPDGTRERWERDGEGNVVAYTDSAGRTTRYEYAGFDLPVARVDADGSRTQYRYDTELRLIEVRNPQGLRWSYAYDPAGRMVHSVDFDGRRHSYRYDAAGQLVKEVNGARQVTRYRYDVLGRMVHRDANRIVSTFGYDATGRLVRAANPDAEVTFERDGSGRVVAETINGRRVSIEWDEQGRIQSRRTPSGVTSTWSYDGSGHPATLTTGGQTLHIEHDRVGRETSRWVDGSWRLVQGFDAEHRLLAQQVIDHAGTVVLRRGLEYAPGGDLVAVQDETTDSRRVELDVTGRVSAVHTPNGIERYTYDPAGNIASAAWPAAGDDPGVGERAYRGTLVESAGALTFQHDVQGRMTARSSGEPGGDWHYQWNAEDRLVAVRAPDGVRWRYAYDALGRRVAKIRLAEDGATELERVEFCWLAETLVEQTHLRAGRATRVTTWDQHPDGNHPVTQLDDGRLRVVITDQIGSPTELLELDGRVSWRRAATLWGLSAAPDEGGTPLRFAGQYHDAETGLHYNNQRYYDPVIGRYLSQDPYGLAAAPNPVSYVTNPQALVDPLGLTPCDAMDIDDVADTAPRRSGRNTGLLNDTIDKQHFWDGPHFGRSDSFKGGSSVNVDLGPGMTRPGAPTGSVPGAAENTAVNALNAQRPEQWIKGHLLNDNIGGKGVSHNLTPMTAVANKSFHDNVEKPIKDALVKARLQGEFNKDKDWIGVEFSAHAEGSKFPNGTPAEQAVANSISVHSGWITRPKGGGEVDILPGARQAQLGLPDLPSGTLDPFTGAFQPH